MDRRLDDVIATCRRLDAGRPSDSIRDEATLRRLLTSLTSSPEGVFVLACGDTTQLVASVVDRIENGRRLATLALLGCADHFPGERLATLLLEPAIAFARRSGRRTLQVEWTAAIAGFTEALEAEGFGHAYDICTMQRPLGSASLGAEPHLPNGFGWASLDVARIGDVHRLLLEAFDTSNSTFVPPLDEFTRTVQVSAGGWQLLLDRDQTAGVVHVQLADGAGEIRTVARGPAYRGRGTGRLLIDRGLRRLASGASSASLQVEARNDRATSLYTSFEFEVVRRVPWFERQLRAQDEL